MQTNNSGHNHRRTYSAERGGEAPFTGKLQTDASTTYVISQIPRQYRLIPRHADWGVVTPNSMSRVLGQRPLTSPGSTATKVTHCVSAEDLGGSPDLQTATPIL